MLNCVPSLHLRQFLPFEKMTVAPLVVAAWTENTSCGYEGMYRACLKVVVRRCPLLSISVTFASPLRSATPLHLVPSANSMECAFGWKLSSNLKNLVRSVMMCAVAPVSTIRPVRLTRPR